jgi:hypothetical protein
MGRSVLAFQPLLYAAAMFISAALLFSIQPIVSKMLLPVLGGSPAVWNTTMVFFQGILVAGYLYAFAVTRFLRPVRQLVLHGVVLLAALYFLPVRVGEATEALDFNHPQIWILLTLLVGVAVPAIAISASTTILQTWFSYSDHKDATDPYFLYAASNLGSLIGLIAYPTLIEPAFGLDAQSMNWGFVYLGFLIMAVACGITIRGRQRLPVDCVAAPDVPVATVWRQRIMWAALAFVPSMMLLGVTLHISVDVASAPFLWIVPLVIYLLTFIIAFARRGLLPRGLVLELHAFVLILLMVYFTASDTWLILGLHIATLFVSCLVCHDLLARGCPPAARLGEFYLCIAVGGWLGGMAAGLIAPVVFDSVLEYPLAVVLACLFRGGAGEEAHRQLPAYLWAGVAVALVLSQSYGFDPVGMLPTEWASIVLYGAIAAALYICRNRVLPFALAIAIITFDSQFLDHDGELLAKDRTFFGMHEVVRSPNGKLNKLFHGTTVHGAQATQEMGVEVQRLPLTYYNREGPIGQLIDGLRRDRGFAEIGVLGLGTGTLACYLRDAERMTFYEIDTTVIRFATTPELFSFLQLCGENTRIVIGDGRLQLERAPDGQYDLLILDAFSSDSIPVHIVTREAIEMYFDKLTEGGVIAIHTSNRFIELAPVIARLAEEKGYAGLIQNYTPDEGARLRSAYDSEWIVVARNVADIAFVAGDDRWAPLASVGFGDLWTDDYSNLFRAVMWPQLLWSYESAAEEAALAEPISE